MGWQRASGHYWRALVQADIACYKSVIGDALRSRTEGRQTTEVAIAAASLNPMLELGRPEYVRLPLMSLRGADCARLLIRATKRRNPARLLRQPDDGRQSADPPN